MANHDYISCVTSSDPNLNTTIETSSAGQSILQSFVKRCPREYAKKNPNKLTNEERSFILQVRGNGAKKMGFLAVAEKFLNKYNRKIAVSTIRRTIQRFEETGSIDDRPRPRRPRSGMEEEIHQSIIQYLKDHPTPEIIEPTGAGMGRDGACRISGSTGGKKLSRRYRQERFKFSEKLLEIRRHDEKLFHHIVFTDDASFDFEVVPGGKSHEERESPAPVDFNSEIPRVGKVNLWTGIVGPHVIGPFFLDDTATSESYLELLRTRVIPRLKELFPTNYDSLHFQQGDSPINHTAGIRKFLDQEFPGRWIASCGPIQWPARSLDLSPLEYYFWGYVEENLSGQRYRDEGDIRAAITTLSRGITPKMLDKVIESFHDRLLFLGLAEGGSFEDQITE